MNLKYLNLNLQDFPQDAEALATVFLIAVDLKGHIRSKGYTNTGCNYCFCVSDLCTVILAMIGYDERPDDLYHFYFDLLEEYCKKITYESDLPVNEAFIIYKILRDDLVKHLNPENPV